MAYTPLTTTAISSLTTTATPTIYSILTSNDAYFLYHSYYKFIIVFLWCKGRRNRQFSTLVPLDEDDVLSASVVEGYRPGDVYNGSEGHRVPGEGSPRQSDDESSSFLRRSRAGGPSFAETSTFAAMSQVPTELGVSHAISRIPPPTTM